MSLKGLPRWKGPFRGPIPRGPFVADLNAYNIPSVAAALIYHLPLQCKAITMRRCGGFAMMAAAEHAAADRNIRIIWRGEMHWATET